MKSVEFNRVTLYEEVWNSPLTTVAKKYGVTGVELKKQCDILKVPTPPSGYWTQVRSGKKIDKPSLYEYTGPDTIKLTNNDNFFGKLRKLNGQSNSKDNIPLATIDEALEYYCSQLVVPNKLKEPHSLIKEMLTSKTNKRAFNKPYFKTSDEQFKRALLIMDTILKAVEYWGGIVNVHKENLQIKIEGGHFNILIKEKIKRIEHVKTKKELLDLEKRRYAYFPQYDYISTGHISFIIDEYWAPRKNWNDTDRKKIESDVGEIVGSIFMTGSILNKRTERRIVEKKIWEEERQARYRLQQLRESELEKIDELEKMAQDHKRAKVIRQFIEELISSSNFSTNNEEKQRLQAYIAWAKEKADWLDPLTAGEDRIFGHKHADWLNKIFTSEHDS